MKVLIGLAVAFLVAGLSILAFTRIHGDCFTLGKIYKSCEVTAVPKQ